MILSDSPPLWQCLEIGNEYYPSPPGYEIRVHARVKGTDIISRGRLRYGQEESLKYILLHMQRELVEAVGRFVLFGETVDGTKGTAT